MALGDKLVNLDDLKVVGDAVGSLKSAVENVTVAVENVNLDTEHNYATALHMGYYSVTGGQAVYVNNSSFSYMAINVTPGQKYQINKTHNLYTMAQFASLGIVLDANNALINSIANIAGGLPSGEPYDITMPENAALMYLNTDYIYTESNVETTVYAYTDEILLDADKLNKENTPLVYYSDFSDSKNVKVLAGVIRNSGSGWQFIQDSGHEPLNLSSVSVNSNGQIVLDYGFTAKKVLSLVVCPDETFAKIYSVGASVGDSQSIINVYTLPKNIGGMVRYTNNQWDISNSNFTAATFTNGILKLTHEDLHGYPLPDVYNVSCECGSAIACINSIGYDQLWIYAYDFSGSMITSPVNNFSIYAKRSLNSNFINANNIVNAGGNFWIYGIMEVD